MSYDLRSYGHIMFLTIQYAIQDREAMLDALNEDGPKKEVQREIDAINRMRQKLFGSMESREEHFLRTARKVSLEEIKDLARQGGLDSPADLEK